MLGERLEDPVGVEGSGDGLAVLPLRTVYSADKVQVRTTATFQHLTAGWAPLNGLTISGYEIRHGRTSATAPVGEALPGGVGFTSDNVLAISLHGMFENPAVMRALFAEDVDAERLLETTFDGLAAALREHLDMARIESLLE